MAGKEIIFKPYFVQKGMGPHISEILLTFDSNEDTFKSDIKLDKDGIKITDTQGKKFGISVKWNVEGYGYMYMPADNEGNYYEPNSKTYSLNYELFKTRIARNRKRRGGFEKDGWKPSRELSAMLDLSENLLNDARKNENSPELCAQDSQTGLKWATLASEQMEIEKSYYNIGRNGYRKEFFFGCDTVGYFHMTNQDLFFDRFSELFNYGTMTHYLIGDMVNFEPEEGNKQFKERDILLDKLLARNITVEGRPLLWTHYWVTPAWLKQKSFDQLKIYLEKHIKEVVEHYKDKIKVWEVANEMHDWANELKLTPDQCVEIVKFACDVARDTNPKVQLLVNNCRPFGDYVQTGIWSSGPALYPQRTSHQFIKDLIDAGADFDIIGAQVYFIHRTLTEMLQSVERFTKFGKTVHMSEVGSTSRGTTLEFVDVQEHDFSELPYEWRRHWDEELQADWLEFTFAYAYGNKMIEAANWYDFLDPKSFLKYGGILRSPNGEKKAAIDRLLKLQSRVKGLKK
ncbi:MAG TPA: endo-1,4-beta-xylanase [Ignavibacteriales bacterium]|nr:endo-1,4-beta-xylanase [Ignavibacteriales bacterium]